MSGGDVLLRGRAITRRWGGLVAVDRVSLELERGSVHAVIGTNGAGKSTLINILFGEIPPSSGAVELLGQDVTAWTQPRRARAGIGHLRGALIGAFAFALLQEFFRSEAIFGGFAKHWHLSLGLTIIASVALLPQGLVGVPGQLRERLLGRSAGARGATSAGDA